MVKEYSSNVLYIYIYIYIYGLLVVQVFSAGQCHVSKILH
jgi:hypothetical protein